MFALKQVRLIPLALVMVMFVGGTLTLADPYFEIWSASEWDDALDANYVVPITALEWSSYMAEWAAYTEQGSPYPSTTFYSAVLYSYNGAGVPPDPDPNTAGGMIMAWGNGSLETGSYASAWKYDYQVDPDLMNAVITLTVYPPQFGINGGITQISFGIQDINGNTRSWYWNVGLGQTIPWDVGTSITIYPAQWGVDATSPKADAFMNNPGFDITTSQFFIADENGAIVGGQVPIPPGGVLPTLWNYWDDIVVQPGNYLFEFSLDIGSDAELSDPWVTGNEAFDPGDVYWWQSAPVVPPGRDGFKDDMFIFGFDPNPDPPDPFVPPATRVPVGMGDPNDYDDYFDLDGHDQTNFTLVNKPFPFPRRPSPCVHDPEYLMVSLEDDGAPGWPANDVPVTVSSPAAQIYDIEIWGVAVPLVPIADEVTVHQNLVPNPNGNNPEDDDVDSLDIVEDPNTCDYWFFSPDHEANLGLNPGGIYEVTLLGPVEVINEVAHLGLPPDTDIDAFEFVWMEDPTDPNQVVLVLLYSVDDDDPLTPLPVDESGGMNPAVIYASMMTGMSWPYYGPLDDDIDALTNWYEPIDPRISR